ncbi:MAG: hypothetical protein ACI9XO_000322 [Paraglaciecola sp.]
MRVACGNAGGLLRDKNPFDKQKHLNCKSAHLWHYQKFKIPTRHNFIFYLKKTRENFEILEFQKAPCALPAAVRVGLLRMKIIIF